MMISVLICTRNRAASLRATLDAVLAQQLGPEADYEVVVVDNGSTDTTRAVVAQVVAALPAQDHRRLRYVYEARPGLSCARNTGLRATRGEIIVCTDDDILPEPTWLREIHREFAAAPHLAMLGGRVLLAHDGLQPIAIVTSEERKMLSRPEEASCVITANFAFRRTLLDQIGGFDTRLGAGSFFAGGEDTDFIYRGLKAGCQLLYAPTVTVYHNHDRTTLTHACQLAYNYGKGDVAYFLKHIWQGDWQVAKVAYWRIDIMVRRVLGLVPESPEMVARSKAYLQGFLRSLFPAVVRMW